MKRKKHLRGLFVALTLVILQGGILSAKTEEADQDQSVEEVQLTTEALNKKSEDGQTLLDVSKGSIVIKSTGATGGGYSQ